MSNKLLLKIVLIQDCDGTDDTFNIKCISPYIAPSFSKFSSLFKKFFCFSTPDMILPVLASGGKAVHLHSALVATQTVVWCVEFW